MMVLHGPEAAILSLVFSPDAAKVYAVHQGIGVHAWTLADRTVSALDVRGSRVWAEFTVHRGGRFAFGTISIPNNRSNLIDLTSGRAKTFNFIDPWGHVALSPDGKHLVTVGYARDAARSGARDPCLCGWKMTATGPRFAWELKSPPDAVPEQVVYAGNGALVTVDVYTRPQPGRGVPRLAVRSAADGAVTATADPPHAEIRQLLAAPDGRQFVARRGTNLWVFDTTDLRKPRAVVEGNDEQEFGRRAAAYHPSGRYLLLAGDGPTVRAFDTAGWEQVHEWEWDVGTLHAVAVSSDGTLAAAAGPCGAVVVWDLDL